MLFVLFSPLCPRTPSPRIAFRSGHSLRTLRLPLIRGPRNSRRNVNHRALFLLLFPSTHPIQHDSFPPPSQNGEARRWRRTRLLRLVRRRPRRSASREVHDRYRSARAQLQRRYVFPTPITFEKRPDPRPSPLQPFGLRSSPSSRPTFASSRTTSAHTRARVPPTTSRRPAASMLARPTSSTRWSSSTSLSRSSARRRRRREESSCSYAPYCPPIRRPTHTDRHVSTRRGGAKGRRNLSPSSPIFTRRPLPPIRPPSPVISLRTVFPTPPSSVLTSAPSSSSNLPRSSPASLSKPTCSKSSVPSSTLLVPRPLDRSHRSSPTTSSPTVLLPRLLRKASKTFLPPASTPYLPTSARRLSRSTRSLTASRGRSGTTTKRSSALRRSRSRIRSFRRG